MIHMSRPSHPRSALDFDEDGQGMMEYSLILLLIAIVVIVVLPSVGTKVVDLLSQASSAF